MKDTRTYSDAETLAAAAATLPRTVAAVVTLADRATCWHSDRYQLAAADRWGESEYVRERREPGETGDPGALLISVGAPYFDGPEHGPELPETLAQPIGCRYIGTHSDRAGFLVGFEPGFRGHDRAWWARLELDGMTTLVGLDRVEFPAWAAAEYGS